MTRDLSALDQDLTASRVVDGIRRDVAVRLAARAGRRRREARRGWRHTLVLAAVAALGAALTWWARRGSR